MAAGITRITDDMLKVASETLAAASPLANNKSDELLPPLTAIAQLSKEIAFAIAQVAFKQNLALPMSDDELLAKIERNFWKPAYREYRRTSV